MTLFGQEISLDMNPNSIKIVFIVLTTVIILGVGGSLIVPKVMTLKEKIKTLEIKNKELALEKQKLAEKQAKIDRLLRIYKQQKAKLDMLKARFKNSTVDETTLKVAIQRMLDHLGIQMMETGASEVVEDKKGYTKRYTPYTIKGKFSRVGRFFHYLENSKWLLTFRGSGLSVKQVKAKSKEKASDRIEVKFKVGAYYIKKEGELDFE